MKIFSAFLVLFILFSFRFPIDWEGDAPLKNFLPFYSDAEQIITHTGYTLCYSEKHEQAKWVAYHLTKQMSEAAPIKRSNDFRPDPFVKTGSATPEDYYRSGYDRGHLCPAGDMKASEQTMSESFYMSNMSPQLPGFNRGIWKRLEEKVRQWSIANEELYVVAGGVLNDTMPFIGRDHVYVPKYFYKIILDYKQPEIKAIGFLMENRSSQRSVFSYAVPVDSIEAYTGINFFHELPDSIENSLESKVDTMLWK